jgi:DNA-3-methyladenine glycosylase II
MQKWDSQRPSRVAHQTYVTRGIAHLNDDPVIAALVAAYPPPAPRDGGDLFVDLVDAIVSQQLSVKAAASIFGRLQRHFNGTGITAPALADADGDLLRSLGLSRRKIEYLHGIARSVVEGSFDPTRLPALPDEDVVTELVRLKGVGPWTAQMLLIFSLGRPDVFAIGDLGLRTAVSRHYGVDRDAHDEILEIARAWSPYRSLACHYLWKSLENAPLS